MAEGELPGGDLHLGPGGAGLAGSAGNDRQAGHADGPGAARADRCQAPPKLTRKEAINKVATALGGEQPPPYDPGPPGAADFEQVQRWAAERGIAFTTWESLPTVDDRRDHPNLPWSKRDFGWR
jgi:hypothetical protein